MKRCEDIKGVFKYYMAKRYGNRVPRKLKKKHTIANKVRNKKAGIGNIFAKSKQKRVRTIQLHQKKLNEDKSITTFFAYFFKNCSDSLGIPYDVLMQDYKKE